MPLFALDILIPFSFNSLQWRHTQTQSAHLIIARVAPLRWCVYPRDQSQISAGVRKSLIYGVYAPTSLQWVKRIGYRWHAGFIEVCACCIAVLSVIGIQLCHIGLSCSKQRQAMNWIPLLFFAEFNWFNLISTWMRCHFASPSGVHMAVLQHRKQQKLWNLHLILALMVMHGHPFIDDRISAY